MHNACEIFRGICYSEKEQPMVIDNATNLPVIPEPNTEGAKDITNMENPDMIRRAFQAFAEKVVETSAVKGQMAELVARMERIENEIAVAREQAAKAIAERDVALAEAGEERRRREIADKAFETVNHERIELQGELTEVRIQLVETRSQLGAERENAIARQHDCDVLRNKSRADEERYDELYARWESERKRAEEAEDSLKALEHEAIGWDKKEEDYKTSIRQLEEAFGQEQAKVHGLENDLAAERLSSEARQGEWKDIKENFNQQLDSKAFSILQLRGDVEALEKSRDLVMESNKTLQGRLTEIQKVLDGTDRPMEAERSWSFNPAQGL